MAALHEALPVALPEDPCKPLASQAPPPNKENTILEIMIAGGSLNRFDAERVGDHCLNTTIAVLRRKGHLFHDEWEEVPTRFGKTVRVKRYRIAPELTTFKD